MMQKLDLYNWGSDFVAWTFIKQPGALFTYFLSRDGGMV